jgi:hypothetical protein
MARRDCRPTPSHEVTLVPQMTACLECGQGLWAGLVGRACGQGLWAGLVGRLSPPSHRRHPGWVVSVDAGDPALLQPAVPPLSSRSSRLLTRGRRPLGAPPWRSPMALPHGAPPWRSPMASSASSSSPSSPSSPSSAPGALPSSAVCWRSISASWRVASRWPSGPSHMWSTATGPPLLVHRYWSTATGPPLRGTGGAATGRPGAPARAPCHPRSRRPRH